MRRSCSMTITASGREVRGRQREHRARREVRAIRRIDEHEPPRRGRRVARGERDRIARERPCARASSPSSRRLPRIAASAGLPGSTNVACAAPRDSASMPERARAREQVEDVAARRRSGPRMLNIASRTFSEVGRVAAPGGARRTRPPRLPPTMRIAQEQCPTLFCGRPACPLQFAAHVSWSGTWRRGCSRRAGERRGSATCACARAIARGRSTSSATHVAQAVGARCAGSSSQRGERVLILMRDTLEAAAAILGVIHAGAVAVPVSELSTPDDVQEYVAPRRRGDRDRRRRRTSRCSTRSATRRPDLREVICVGAKLPGSHDFHSSSRPRQPQPPVADRAPTTSACSSTRRARAPASCARSRTASARSRRRTSRSRASCSS